MNYTNLNYCGKWTRPQEIEREGEMDTDKQGNTTETNFRVVNMQK